MPHSQIAPTVARPPIGLKWRSSARFVTLVVGFGITTDIFAYAIIIPVIPFRLEDLGHSNSSELTAWLLFAYSAGLVLSTPFIAYYSEHYNSRRTPLLVGLFTLIGSQILFMLSPFYLLLVLARVIQGVSSSIVWTIGLALVCDTVPPSRAGQQLGLALSGLSIGFVLAPPIGGALYRKFGLHAPLLLCIGIATFDVICRLLIIERKDALRWGIDPAALPAASPPTEDGATSSSLQEEPFSVTDGLTYISENHEAGSFVEKVTPAAEQKCSSEIRSSVVTCNSDTIVNSPLAGVEYRPSTSTVKPEVPEFVLPENTQSEEPEHSTTTSTNRPKFTAVQVLKAIFHSRRACSSLILTFIFGVSLSAQEPTLPLRLQSAYQMSSAQVGLVYLAASVPTLMSTAIAGWLSDRTGTALVTLLCAVMTIPWFIVMAIHGPLALMIIGVVISTFFSSAVVAPLSVELAAATRDLPGVGYSYIYGAFNLCYGIGSLVGPILGGQIYDHRESIPSWSAVMALLISLMILATVVTFFFTDEVPYARRIMRRWNS